MMELDPAGWPQLPIVGSQIQFCDGGISLTVLGVCTVVRADHVRNAAGKPGGRVTLQTTKGELISVPLTQLRQHAELLSDGL
jgi:hypothetical protein